ncbi:HlyD family secretion protein [Vibrio genomosp. F10]|uniref:Efflux transporter periplasmic adaptor subunit n=1 Tax=Vibrio genomosp. F10 TaxID=723171 RepID=A0A1B9R074_9VIBR|nr:HlyD family secretion protein [Vibrio genomosp. F10]OCH77183.1 efflux transporter periplasmic adaptor subunit [Vibrio genomosp. F10]OEE96587.1 efflux transporter periplasmic adaptor subunit [Vibrio genomosp. F10 str. 9ZD137]OEE97488.1 efflux transporter periplasmic adaptor subunit [Vibrio genomosp. F10 str. 9ZC157]OEF08558.1 efflux transporter periplasmic adaptor subunit [Vibrio genomosp. F10 str. 9ZB36]
MIKRYLLTTILALVAGYGLITQYNLYTENPWTRDGQVRAYIIEITPRVTGQVVDVHIQDNSKVKQGELLFEIDDSVYRTALHKAQASLHQASALLKKSLNEEARALNLERLTPGSLPILTLNNLEVAVETAKANQEIAKAMVDEAELNLSFTKVYAPADGYITNFTLRVGSQVIANSPVVALIDEHSFWIEGFFKETDLQGVDPQDRAMVTLLTHKDVLLEGEIKSIGYGIAKQDGSTGNDLLPNVNPNFQWIRLAQRIPVKVKLTKVPENIQLRVGSTASIKIIKGN